MTDWIRTTAMEGGGQVWVEAIFLLLPLSPQAINVAVKHEEQRIARCGIDTRDEPTEASVCGIMRIELHVSKRRVGWAKGECCGFVDNERPSCRGSKERTTVYTGYAISGPKLEWVVCAERNRTEIIVHTHEIKSENVWGGTIETPVMQRDTRIDRLELSFKIE